MDKEQREIVSNYVIAMRQEIRALQNWAMGYEYFSEHLGKMESLARNCAQKISTLELQEKLFETSTN